MKPAYRELILTVLKADETVSGEHQARILEVLDADEPADALLTAADVARRLGCFPSTVWRMVDKMELKPTRLSGPLVRFLPADVDALEKAGKRRGKPVAVPKQPSIEID